MLGIAKSTCSSFSDLAPLAFLAAQAASEASKTPNAHEKRKVLGDCRRKFNCYSCGGELDPQALSQVSVENGKLIPNPQYLEYEHLWPHSFGGDSIAENLLPSCPYCNRAKANVASWEWMPVQSVIPEFLARSPTLSGPKASKQVKIGLHIRAATACARLNGTTLKNAYIAIGPRLNDIHVVDTSDTADFFNLRVHNPEETGMLWGF